MKTSEYHQECKKLLARLTETEERIDLLKKTGEWLCDLSDKYVAERKDPNEYTEAERQELLPKLQEVMGRMRNEMRALDEERRRNAQLKQDIEDLMQQRVIEGLEED
jgi:cell division protein FtsB